MPRKTTKIIALVLCFLLIFEQSGFAQVAGQLDIALHLNAFRNSLSPDKFRPVHLRYLAYNNSKNNFKLLLDKGDLKNPKTQDLEGSTQELLNFFFVGVSLPNNSFWVNLRPDSPDNIIDPDLAKTEIGRIFLEADLELKKDTANYTNPHTLEGKQYWERLYQKAEELFGYENITIPTLTRPWIVPGEIIIREAAGTAYIYKATLKVMLEQDYLKNSATYNFTDERLKQLNEYASGLIRELIIPKLTKEINNAKKYAPLRQVYYSLILAQWFKQKYYGQDGFYSRLIDRKNLNGLAAKISYSPETYFKAYQESFNKGEYNLKEAQYTPYGQVMRSYLSGGIAFPDLATAATVVTSTRVSTSGDALAALPGDLLKKRIPASQDNGSLENIPGDVHVDDAAVANSASEEQPAAALEVSAPVVTAEQKQGGILSGIDWEKQNKKYSQGGFIDFSGVFAWSAGVFSKARSSVTAVLGGAASFGNRLVRALPRLLAAITIVATLGLSPYVNGADSVKAPPSAAAAQASRVTAATPENIRSLALTIYAEMGVYSQGSDYLLKMTASSALNGLFVNRPKEFGSDLDGALQRFNAKTKENVLYRQASQNIFPTSGHRHLFERCMKLSEGLLNGSIQPTKYVQFYFTQSEIEKLKGNGFDFSKVQSVGTVGRYTMFVYKGDVAKLNKYYAERYTGNAAKATSSSAPAAKPKGITVRLNPNRGQGGFIINPGTLILECVEGIATLWNRWVVARLQNISAAGSGASSLTIAAKDKEAIINQLTNFFLADLEQGEITIDGNKHKVQLLRRGGEFYSYTVGGYEGLVFKIAHAPLNNTLEVSQRQFDYYRTRTEEIFSLFDEARTTKTIQGFELIKVPGFAACRFVQGAKGRGVFVQELAEMTATDADLSQMQVSLTQQGLIFNDSRLINIGFVENGNGERELVVIDIGAVSIEGKQEDLSQSSLRLVDNQHNITLSTQANDDFDSLDTLRFNINAGTTRVGEVFVRQESKAYTVSGIFISTGQEAKGYEEYALQLLLNRAKSEGKEFRVSHITDLALWRAIEKVLAGQSIEASTGADIWYASGSADFIALATNVNGETGKEKFIHPFSIRVNFTSQKVQQPLGASAITKQAGLNAEDIANRSAFVSRMKIFFASTITFCLAVLGWYAFQGSLDLSGDIQAQQSVPALLMVAATGIIAIHVWLLKIISSLGSKTGAQTPAAAGVWSSEKVARYGMSLMSRPHQESWINLYETMVVPILKVAGVTGETHFTFGTLMGSLATTHGNDVELLTWLVEAFRQGIVSRAEMAAIIAHEIAHIKNGAATTVSVSEETDNETRDYVEAVDFIIKAELGSAEDMVRLLDRIPALKDAAAKAGALALTPELAERTATTHQYPQIILMIKAQFPSAAFISPATRRGGILSSFNSERQVQKRSQGGFVINPGSVIVDLWQRFIGLFQTEGSRKFKQFMSSLAKDRVDRKLAKIIQSSPDWGFWLPYASARGISGNALYTHEMVEFRLDVDRYGMTLRELRKNDPKRLEVYPRAHSDALQAQYTYLQEEARKNGYNLSLASLMITDAMVFNEEAADPDNLAWNISNYIIAVFSGKIDVILPTADEIEQAIKFYQARSLPDNAQIQTQYRAAAQYAYAVARHMAPVLQTVQGKITTDDMNADSIRYLYEQIEIYFHANYVGGLEGFQLVLKEGQARAVLQKAITDHQSELLTNIPRFTGFALGAASAVAPVRGIAPRLSPSRSQAGFINLGVVADWIAKLRSSRIRETESKLSDILGTNYWGQLNSIPGFSRDSLVRALSVLNADNCSAVLSFLSRVDRDTLFFAIRHNPQSFVRLISQAGNSPELIRSLNQAVENASPIGNIRINMLNNFMQMHEQEYFVLNPAMLQGATLSATWRMRVQYWFMRIRGIPNLIASSIRNKWVSYQQAAALRKINPAAHIAQIREARQLQGELVEIFRQGAADYQAAQLAAIQTRTGRSSSNIYNYAMIRPYSAGYRQGDVLQELQTSRAALDALDLTKLESMLLSLKQFFPKQCIDLFSRKDAEVNPNQAAGFFEENMRLVSALPEATRSRIALSTLRYILSLEPARLQTLINNFGLIYGVDGQALDLLSGHNETELRWIVENESKVPQLCTVLGILYPQITGRMFLRLADLKACSEILPEEAQQIHAVILQLDPNLASLYQATVTTLLALTTDAQLRQQIINLDVAILRDWQVHNEEDLKSLHEIAKYLQSSGLGDQATVLVLTIIQKKDVSFVAALEGVQEYRGLADAQAKAFFMGDTRYENKKEMAILLSDWLQISQAMGGEFTASATSIIEGALQKYQAQQMLWPELQRIVASTTQELKKKALEQITGLTVSDIVLQDAEILSRISVVISLYYSIMRTDCEDKEDMQAMIKEGLQVFLRTEGSISDRMNALEASILDKKENKEEIDRLTSKKIGFSRQLWQGTVEIKGFAQKGLSKEEKELYTRKHIQDIIHMAKDMGLLTDEEIAQVVITSYEEAEQFVNSVMRSRKQELLQQKKMSEDEFDDWMEYAQNVLDQLQSVKTMKERELGDDRQEEVRIVVGKNFLNEASVGAERFSKCFNVHTGVHREMVAQHALEANALFAIAYDGQGRQIGNAVLVLTDAGVVVFGSYHRGNVALDAMWAEAWKELLRRGLVPAIILNPASAGRVAGEKLGRSPSEKIVAQKPSVLWEDPYFDFGEVDDEGDATFNISNAVVLNRDSVERAGGFIASNRLQQEWNARRQVLADEAQRQQEAQVKNAARVNGSRANNVRQVLFGLGLTYVELGPLIGLDIASIPEEQIPQRVNELVQLKPRAPPLQGLDDAQKASMLTAAKEKITAALVAFKKGAEVSTVPKGGILSGLDLEKQAKRQAEGGFIINPATVISEAFRFIAGLFKKREPAQPKTPPAPVVLHDLSELKSHIAKYESALPVTSQVPFSPGAINSEQAIRSITAISGNPMDTINQRAQRNAYAISGFADNVIEQMVIDNRIVEALGVTHKDLGNLMLLAIQLYEQYGSEEFMYNGMRMKVDIFGTRGIQDSIFADGYAWGGSNSEVVITNFTQGTSLKFTPGNVAEISALGFYEAPVVGGQKNEYAIDPQKLWRMFNDPDYRQTSIPMKEALDKRAQQIREKESWDSVTVYSFEQLEQNYPFVVRDLPVRYEENQFYAATWVSELDETRSGRPVFFEVRVKGEWVVIVRIQVYPREVVQGSGAKASFYNQGIDIFRNNQSVIVDDGYNPDYVQEDNGTTILDICQALDRRTVTPITENERWFYDVLKAKKLSYNEILILTLNAFLQTEKYREMLLRLGSFDHEHYSIYSSSSGILKELAMIPKSEIQKGNEDAVVDLNRQKAILLTLLFEAEKTRPASGGPAAPTVAAMTLGAGSAEAWFNRSITINIPFETLRQNHRLILDKIDSMVTALQQIGKHPDKDNIADIDVNSYIAALAIAKEVLADTSLDAERFEEKVFQFHEAMSPLFRTNGYKGYMEAYAAGKVHRVIQEIFSKEAQEEIRRDPVLYAAKVFVEIVKAQAFYDGNHRVADFVLNFILVKNGLNFFALTPENLADYYSVSDAVDLVDGNYRIEDVADFFRREINKSRINGKHNGASAVTLHSTIQGLFVSRGQGGQKQILVNRNNIAEHLNQFKTLLHEGVTPEEAIAFIEGHEALHAVINNLRDQGIDLSFLTSKEEEQLADTFGRAFALGIGKCDPRLLDEIDRIDALISFQARFGASLKEVLKDQAGRLHNMLTTLGINVTIQSATPQEMAALKEQLEREGAEVRAMLGVNPTLSVAQNVDRLLRDLLGISAEADFNQAFDAQAAADLPALANVAAEFDMAIHEVAKRSPGLGMDLSTRSIPIVEAFFSSQTAPETFRDDILVAARARLLELIKNYVQRSEQAEQQQQPKTDTTTIVEPVLIEGRVLTEQEELEFDRYTQDGIVQAGTAKFSLPYYVQTNWEPHFPAWVAKSWVGYETKTEALAKAREIVADAKSRGAYAGVSLEDYNKGVRPPTYTSTTGLADASASAGVPWIMLLSRKAAEEWHNLMAALRLKKGLTHSAGARLAELSQQFTQTVNIALGRQEIVAVESPAGFRVGDRIVVLKQDKSAADVRIITGKSIVTGNLDMVAARGGLRLKPVSLSAIELFQEVKSGKAMAFRNNEQAREILQANTAILNSAEVRRAIEGKATEGVQVYLNGVMDIDGRIVSLENMNFSATIDDVEQELNKGELFPFAISVRITDGVMTEHRFVNISRPGFELVQPASSLAIQILVTSAAMASQSVYTYPHARGGGLSMSQVLSFSDQGDIDMLVNDILIGMEGAPDAAIAERINLVWERLPAAMHQEFLERLRQNNIPVPAGLVVSETQSTTTSSSVNATDVIQAGPQSTLSIGGFLQNGVSNGTFVRYRASRGDVLDVGALMREGNFSPALLGELAVQLRVIQLMAFASTGREEALRLAQTSSGEMLGMLQGEIYDLKFVFIDRTTNEVTGFLFASSGQLINTSSLSELANTNGNGGGVALLDAYFLLLKAMGVQTATWTASWPDAFKQDGGEREGEHKFYARYLNTRNTSNQLASLGEFVVDVNTVVASIPKISQTPPAAERTGISTNAEFPASTLSEAQDSFSALNPSGRITITIQNTDPPVRLANTESDQNKILRVDLNVCLGVAAYNSRTGERVMSHMLPTGHLTSGLDYTGEAMFLYLSEKLKDLQGPDWRVMIIASTGPQSATSPFKFVTTNLIREYLVNRNNIERSSILINENTVTMKFVTLDGEGIVRIFYDGLNKLLTQPLVPKLALPIPDASAPESNSNDQNTPPAAGLSTGSPVTVSGPAIESSESQLEKTAAPADSAGGINLSALPIVTQTVPLQQAVFNPQLNRQPNMQSSDPQLNAEWQGIEQALNAGIIPSNERIKEYILEVCANGNCTQEFDKVLSCIADILRLEEERCAPTAPALKDMLMLLESNKSAQEMQLALATVQADEEAPDVVTE